MKYRKPNNGRSLFSTTDTRWSVPALAICIRKAKTDTVRRRRIHVRQPQTLSLPFLLPTCIPSHPTQLHLNLIDDCIRFRSIRIPSSSSLFTRSNPLYNPQCLLPIPLSPTHHLLHSSRHFLQATQAPKNLLYAPPHSSPNRKPPRPCISLTRTPLKAVFFSVIAANGPETNVLGSYGKMLRLHNLT
jgi:hypothetical protein